MPLSPDSKKVYPSTYILQRTEDELKRLNAFGHMLTEGMGGALPEQPHPERFVNVLDVGCGTGEWLIKVAKTYPHMTTLVGIDSNNVVIEYARAQAKAEHVSDRVQFQIMDALRVLEFPPDTFDLVNHRSAISWLRTWEWQKLLNEYQRVCKEDGVIRITEVNWPTTDSSNALMFLTSIATEAMYRGGYQFEDRTDGFTSHLAALLQQYGLQDVQTYKHTLEIHAGTPQWEGFYQNNEIAFRTMLPFFHKWVKVVPYYDAAYEQMLDDFTEPDFEATWNLLTAWGHP